jgi:hypothetical protein
MAFVLGTLRIYLDWRRIMIFLKSIAIWLTFIFAESLNGTVRNLWLIPTIGDRLANQISFASGSLLILTIATLFIGWLNPSGITQMLGIGILWLLLTLGFEVGLGHYILGYSWDRIAADYNLFEGGLMSIGLMVVMLSPWIAAKIQRILSKPDQHA